MEQGVIRVQKICGAQILYDLWDELGSFREAFCVWAERLTQGYDAAVASGLLPTTHDLSTETEGPDVTHARDDLRAALARGEGALGSIALAEKYGCHRSTVARIAKELGVTLATPTMTALAEYKAVAWACYDSGEQRPRYVMAALREQFPNCDNLPSFRTLQNWGQEYRGTR